MARRAVSIPFWIAAGTSLALPYPIPTLPAPSPTTTRAVKLNRRPPLATLATRLIWMTRSSNCVCCSGPFSELQSGFASCVGKGLDLAVELVATPIENHRAHTGVLGTPGEASPTLAPRSRVQVV